MTNGIPKAFFAYPSSPPTLKEPIQDAIHELNTARHVNIQTWEKCSIGGKLIIDTICEAIDDSELFFADLTGCNANVMFELGYAIARDKRIWPIFDESYTEEKKMFDQLKVLSTVGYVPCCNSDDIVSGFCNNNPLKDMEKTIYRTTIEPNLKPHGYHSILYLKSQHENQAGMRMSDLLNKRMFKKIIIDDPRESTVRPLTWYGIRVFGCKGLVCHFTNPARAGASLQTARHALVCGMAYGAGIPLLMLAEGEFLSPIDYRDYLKHYDTAPEALRYLKEWLPSVEQILKADQEETSIPRSTARLIPDKILTPAEGYLQPLESFESRYIKHVQDRHIYLETYVPGTGREECIKALEHFASQMDKRVLLIHAQGGIGKTRFVLESLKPLEKQNPNIDILFNKRRKYVSVDEVIPEISLDRESLIVLDDAHLIDNLTDFANILLERDYVKMILITRSTASGAVKRAIGYRAEEMKLTSLDRDASIELLKRNLETPLRDEYLRYAADMCEGNPLLIGITVHLINKGEIHVW